MQLNSRCLHLTHRGALFKWARCVFCFFKGKEGATAPNYNAAENIKPTRGLLAVAGRKLTLLLLPLDS